MSRPCALCQQNVDVARVDHIRFHLTESLSESGNGQERESQPTNLTILQTLISSTAGRSLAGPLAIEVNELKRLLRSANELGGLQGVLTTVRVLRTPIEVSQFAIARYKDLTANDRI